MKLKNLLLSTALTLSLAFSGSAESSADDLTTSLSLAYSTNPQLIQGRKLLEQTNENVPIAKSSWLPNVILNANHQYFSQNFRRGVPNAPGVVNTTTVGVQVDQNLFRGFRTWHETDKAIQQVWQQRANLKNTEQQVILAAVQAYLDVYQNEKTLERRIESENILRKQLKAVRDRFEVGEITRTDVAQAESRLAQAEANTAQARTDLKQARAEYFQQIGKYPEKLERPTILMLMPTSLEQALAMAESGNPNVQAAGNAYQIAIEDVNIAEGFLLPEVTLQALARRQFSDVNPQEIDQFILTLNANIPLYQRGLRHAQVRQTKKAVQVARYALYTTYRDVAQTVKELWGDFQATTEQIKAFRTQVEAARIAFEGASQEAFLGAKSTLDVLDLQDDLINAEINLIAAERNRDFVAYQLFNLVGKLTAQDLQLPVEYYDYEAHYQEVKNKFFGLGDAVDPIKPYTEEYLR